MRLNKVNLNLIRHFDTLIREQSVSKAAEKSYVTQAAMSHILKQLRELFDDELFIKVGNHLKPTKKTLHLAPKIQHFILSAHDLFENETFNPLQDVVNFNALLFNYAEQLYLSRLFLYLSDKAPNCHLNVIAPSTHLSLEYLLADDIDFAIAPEIALEEGKSSISKSDLLCEVLTEEQGVCLMRRDHPLTDQEMTTSQYLDAEHIDIIFSDVGRKLFNKKVADFRERNIKLSVSNLLNTLEILSNSDCIATVPQSMALHFKDKYQLQIKPFPLSRESYKIMFVYHKRLVNHQPLQWILSVMKTLV